MTDKKLTDNEIIKALECRVKGKCPECPYFHSYPCDKCKKLDKDALDLINRLQAEVERLKENLNIELENFATEYDNKIKAEAYKEFAEKAVERVDKAKQKYQRLCKEQGEEMEEYMHIHFNGIVKIINNLLKELVGEDNG